MPVPSIGQEAPDFTAPATGGRTITLSDLRGQPVVLVFYPGDATPVCTAQLGSYADDMASFADVDAAVLAVSPQDVDSHERWEAARGEPFPFPLVADPDKAIGRAYGVLGPLGFYRRSVFVVDHGGRICWAHRAMSGLTYKPVAEIVAAIHACRPPGG